MKKNQLKNKIISSFEEITPEMNESVIVSLENSVQVETPIVEANSNGTATLANKKRNITLISLAMALILIVGILLGRFVNVTPTIKAFSSIYLDVNPSIQLDIDKDNTVVECTPNNEDAQKVIGNMKLEGMDVSTALNALIGSMYINGYLSDDENSLLLSLDTQSEEITSVLSGLVSNVNSVFENTNIKCSIIAQVVNKEQETVDRAKDNNVSLGKMSLIEKIVESSEETETNIEDLSKLSIKDLSFMYSSYKEWHNAPSDREEIISGEVNGFMDKNTILDVIATDLEIAKEDIVNFEYRSTYKSQENDYTMIYDAKIKVKDGNEYEYVIDCHTGVILDKKGMSSQPPRDEGNEGEGEESPPPRDEGSDDEGAPTQPPYDKGNGEEGEQAPPPLRDEWDGREEEQAPPLHDD